MPTESMWMSVDTFPLPTDKHLKIHVSLLGFVLAKIG